MHFFSSYAVDTFDKTQFPAVQFDHLDAIEDFSDDSNTLIFLLHLAELILFHFAPNNGIHGQQKKQQAQTWGGQFIKKKEPSNDTTLYFLPTNTATPIV